MDFLAQPALRSDAKAVADDEHANHEFGIDRGPASVAVERRQMLAQLAEIEEAVNASQQVIAGDVIFEVDECVEKLVMNGASAHHDADLHQ